MSTNKLNTENIFRYVYDPATQSLRTGITATLPPGTIDISIDDSTDSIKVGDGTGKYLKINSDGSINVVTDTTPSIVTNYYDEVDTVVSGVTTVIGTYTATADSKIVKIEVAGTNKAMYSVYIDGNIQAKKYTYFTQYNECFSFEGLAIASGSTVTVEVVHSRPEAGDFNSQILIST